MITPVILSGGSGTRLWPVSRSSRPKQLRPIMSPKTMLQETTLRVLGEQFRPPTIVASEDHRFEIVEQLGEIRCVPSLVILEPQGRNTAPAIALAAMAAVDADADGLILVMPSDHLVADEVAFKSAIVSGLAAARKGMMVTFGIEPDRAETGFGYVERGAYIEPGVFSVASFREKPDRANAEKYLQSGEYYWNSGIFLFRARNLLDELDAQAPAVMEACLSAYAVAKLDGQFLRPEPAAFARSPSISIDYAMMEKTSLAAVVPVSMGWSDVGAWDAVWENSAKDASGNVLSGDVVQTDCHDNLIRIEGGAPIAAIGVSGFTMISTRDAVLVMPHGRAQDVKGIVDQLKANGDDRHAAHAIVHRPWGTYESVDVGASYQTKRIVVKSGAKLSLQMHHYRSEHWIVVAGTARVTVGDRVSTLGVNEATYIPAGTQHRLENPGETPLCLIEVQCGTYLGEDDIVRFEDSYGRVDSVMSEVSSAA